MQVIYWSARFSLLVVFISSANAIPLQVKSVKEKCAADTDTYLADAFRNCEVVYLNTYIQWSEEMLADPRFTHDLEIIDFTNRSGDHRELTASADSMKNIRRKRDLMDDCPVFDEKYIQTHKAPKDLSTSPWKYVINYDEHRLPQRIVDTVCRCHGCIDTLTGIEDMNMASIPLSVRVPVAKKKTRKLFSIHINVGCTCAFANFSSK